MSKHEIKFDSEKADEKLNEQELINEISKNEFFDWMTLNGYNFNKIKNVLDNKKISTTEQYKFNEILRKAKKEVKISLIESIVFLEESFIKFKKIIDVLDNETKFELKKELSEKYHIKMDKSNLSQIFR
jgi:hypothetical protein